MMMILLSFLNLCVVTAIYGFKYTVATWQKQPQEREIIFGKFLQGYLLSLGPIYIKLGQVLATRSDLLPDGIVNALRQLQDNVPPMDAATTKAILQQEFNRPLEEIFTEFSWIPIASASIAQVHKAVLITGQTVAIKVVKKNIRQQLEANLSLIQALAGIAHHFLSRVKHLNLPNRLTELKSLLLAQADMGQEAAKQEAIHLNFKQHPYVRIPALIKELCTSNMLVMEFVTGIPGKQAHRCQLPPSQLARRFQDTIYTMLYMDGLCHGDPHPGNLFFTQEGEIIFVDFGITVELSEDEKWGLSSFYYACTRQEWDIAVERFTQHFVSQKQYLKENWQEYKVAIKEVLQKHFDEKTERWSTISYFHDINQILNTYKAQYTTNFTKVELVFLSCEGFATQINSDIDIWANARKFTDRYSPYMNPSVKQTFDQYFSQAIPQSLQLREQAKTTLVAPTHIDRYFFPSTYPLFIKQAHGSHLEDMDGNDFVDLACGYGPHILGYAHPIVTAAISEAITLGGVNAIGHLSEVQLAQMIVSAFPSAEKVIFSNSGTEAIIQAFRLCRAYRQRDRIAKFEGHYHGFSDQGMVSSWFRFTGSKEHPLPMAGTQGSHSGVVDNTLVLQYGHFPSLERLRQEAPTLAAVICEPMPTALADYDVHFLQELRTICSEFDLPLIFDEVVSGFRVTYGGIQNLTEVLPDLTCLGKIIGGGLPCGAVAGKKSLIEIAKSTEDPFRDYESKTFVGGTMSGNSLSCTAGMATLSYLKDHPEIYHQLETQTEWLAQELRQNAQAQDVPFQVKANRSIFSMTFSYKKAKFYREKQTGSNFKANIALAYYMRKHGVYMPELHTLMLNAAHTQEDLEKVSQAFTLSLQEMVADGFFTL
jgi:glutamate-1-semialdehyde 2,1-aminomutase